MLNAPNLDWPAEAGAPDDSTAVQAARRDPTAFATLYRRYVTPVYRYVYSRVGNRTDTQDLTAQVFLAALERLDSYRERGNFAAWLFTIARRRVADYWRRPATLPFDELTDVPGEQDVHEQASHDDALAQLQRLLVKLNDDEQELLRLRFAAGLSFDQIATVLGRKETAVKMATHRLLQKMNVMWGATS